ncbi:hypothetical protein TSTA_085370 [Talaromyces stipitatus ATCC 10500]|uniref:Catalase core domain-containing protein n=1 Tax=Talaromyces stipitatus (strain ATCC 10500 / CBS 375.48 / QM 6759 / NRRL 1006) TaxID=441959 RepID=B8M0K9_TALSN|nr:uncharacterized protein TSTA_085370 [Talaromyces stipitatus ATCC 10500]EED21306.1 hypothetical protein TSTA_085370 [Talaromyces stipitatus ATCC 10500]
MATHPLQSIGEVIGQTAVGGSRALGYLETTKDISNLTKLSLAHFLRSPGIKTPIVSTVTLRREFPDSARNPRGFAIKLYISERS